MSVPDRLRKAASLFQEREHIYGANYNRTGAALAAFFPDGIKLKTKEDFTRFHLLTTMVAKLGRHSYNAARGGHQDSLTDLAVYSIILQELEDEDLSPD